MDSTQRWLAAVSLRAQWRDRLDEASRQLKSADLNPTTLALAEQTVTIYEQVIHELEAFLHPDEE
jgi:hypothetical protein